MCVKYLLNRWRLIVRVDVPNLKLSVKCADEEMIFVDLVQEGRVLVIVNLVLYGPVPRLDIDVTDQYLLVVEAGDGENRRRSLEERLRMQLNHGVAGARLGSPDEHRCYGWLRNGLFVLALFIFLFLSGGWLLFRLFCSTHIAIVFSNFFGLNRFFNFWLRLQVRQLFCVTIEIEQLRDSVRLAQRRVNVDVTVAASRREVLVPQFAERNDLNDGLGVRPRLN